MLGIGSGKKTITIQVIGLWDGYWNPKEKWSDLLATFPVDIYLVATNGLPV